jgi:hypothetical protein
MHIGTAMIGASLGNCMIYGHQVAAADQFRAFVQ